MHLRRPGSNQRRLFAAALETMLGDIRLILLAFAAFAWASQSKAAVRFARADGSTASMADSTLTTVDDGQSTTRQARINCALQDFVATSDECCSQPMESLFPLAAQKDCNKRQDERGDSLLNGVMLNRLQDWRKNNELNYSGLIVGKIFGPAVCFADCVLRENNLLTESEVDSQKLLEYVTRNRSDPWKSILTEAVAVCKNYTNAIPVKEISFQKNLQKRTCKTEAVHMVQCLQAVIALNCPSELPSSHAKSSKCSQKIDNLDTCVKIIHKEIGRTEYLKKVANKSKTIIT